LHSMHAVGLSEQGYIRISQLARGLTVHEMQSHCPEPSEGMAKVILKQANKNVSIIQRHQDRNKRCAKHWRYT
jgi:hypothetical protein